MAILDLLQLGFMQRALLGGVIVSLLCAIWGIFIVLRRQAFLTDAVAHASLTGIAIGLLLGWSYLPLAMVVAVILAICITYFKSHTQLSDDTLIGILYTFLFALGVILLNVFPAYRPDLLTYLFGSLMAISWGDIAVSALVLIASVLLLILAYRKLLYVTFDPEAAKIRGIKTGNYEYLINIVISLVTIVAIKSVGIVMVSALLLIPAAGAKILSKDFKQMLPISITLSLCVTILGVFASYFLNTPTGATIVVTATLFFGLCLLLVKFNNNHGKQ